MSEWARTDMVTPVLQQDVLDCFYSSLVSRSEMHLKLVLVLNEAQRSRWEEGRGIARPGQLHSAFRRAQEEHGAQR